jgi:hypothetical protein
MQAVGQGWPGRAHRVDLKEDLKEIKKLFKENICAARQKVLENRKQ